MKNMTIGEPFLLLFTGQVMLTGHRRILLRIAPASSATLPRDHSPFQ